MTDIKQNNEINEKELESISGGTYSSSTYAQLGMDVTSIQYPNNHPLITTSLNSCPRGGGKYCKDCEFRGKAITSISFYCLARCAEMDPWN